MRGERGGAVRVVGLLAAVLGPATLRAQQPAIDVESYRFNLTIPDTSNLVTGTAQIRFKVLAPDTLRLNLVGMTIDAVSVPYSYDGRVIKIVAPTPSVRPRSVSITYHGVPQDGLIIGTNARGHRSAFGDNWPERARFWLPIVDHPSDKAAVSFIVQVPRGWEVVSNGLSCPAKRGCYSEARPIPPYTMVIGAGNFTVSEHRPLVHGTDTIPMEVWTYPEDSAFADSGPFRNATEIVETLERIVGPFPYEKLAHVESATRYGGMENSSAIFYAEQPYVRRTMREGVVRHETSHQWFGDAVTERDWHHLWLSEGFASYFDLVVGAALHGDSVLVNGMRNDAAEYLKSKVVNRAIIDTTTDDPNQLLNANVYPKGAWVLHMVRGQVGDSAFFRGIREYYRRYRDSTALSEDFQRVLEEASGQKLGWFFQQWLRQPGYPQLECTWSYDAGSHTVTLHVRQTQPAAWGLFTLPSLTAEAGAADRAPESSVRDTVRVAGLDVTTRFTVPFRPARVTLDPDGRYLMTSQVHEAP